MPKCLDCKFFNPVTQTCSLDDKYHPRSAVRNCVTGIVTTEIEALAKTAEPNVTLRVLEVGAGVWKHPRWECRRFGIEWTGVDPRWKENNEKMRMFSGKASSIPFPRCHFDMVLALETMEHWHEYRDDVAAGLQEINRVLKPNKRLVVTVPIHLHGGPEFVRGDLRTILDRFDEKKWDVTWEDWRREHKPLPVHRGWMNNRRWRTYKKQTEEGFALNKTLGGPQDEPSSWTFNITAVKK